MRTTLSARSLFALCAVVLLSACVGGTQPSRLYVLAATEPAAQRSTQGVALSVGPIVLPKYLDRPQIVTRPTANELTVAEFDRWGGRLEDNVTQVIGENLSRRLRTSRVALFPAEAAVRADLRVSVTISRFECVGDSGECVLDARWQIVGQGDGVAAPSMGASGLVARPANASYTALAAAMSQLLGDLSREIADGVSARTSNR
jgi:uncharacterized lipoprotein YmbA